MPKPVVLHLPVFFSRPGHITGKTGYFQLMAHDMPKPAEKYWQVEYNRSGNFIATVRSIIGQVPDF